MSGDLAMLLEPAARGISGAADSLRKGNRCAVLGLTGSAKPLHLLLLLRRLRRSILLVTAGDSEAEAWERDLGTWQTLLGGERIPVAALPPLGADPYQGLSPHHQVSCERVVGLNNLMRPSPSVLLVPARSLYTYVPSPALFASALLALRTGGTLSPDHLCARLMEGGYLRVENVSSPGEFARRGGVIDLFLPQDEVPCRFEFYGEEIESIRSFNPETQRSMDPLSSIDILPVRETPLTDDTVASLLARLEGRGNGRGPGRRSELIEELKETGTFPGIEAFARLLDPRAVPLYQFSPEALLVVEEPEGVRSEVAQSWEEILSAFEFSEAFGLPSPEEVFVAKSDLEAVLEQAPLVFSELPLTERPEEYRITCRQGRVYRDRLQALAADLGEAASRGWKSLMVVGGPGRRERLSEILHDLGEPATLVEKVSDPLPRTASRFIVEGHLENGFTLPDAGLMVLAEKDLFGEVHEREVRRRRIGVFSPDFRDLKVGDLVVHAEHGIGLYAGVRRMSEGADGSDFMELHYEGRDKLFVPLERLDLIQRYSSSGGRIPRLDRLGGATWEKAKGRVRRAVRDMAEELLRLYAERKASPGHPFSADTPWQREFETSFPFEETDDQRRTIREVKKDMESNLPMERLLCGDVGFGKTEVALRAIFKAVMDGKQTAILVPTTVLAAQHQFTFRERVSGFPIRVEMLSRFRSPAEQKALLRDLDHGKVDIIIGTHRLLSRDVRFKDLGLLVVDEEQRFGVAAKERIKRLKKNVDVLAMSATPIPRTLQLSLAGIRDLSVIETPPANRLAIQTHIVPFRSGVIATAIRNELKRRGQVYFVHNRVESIASMATLLRRTVPEARIAVAHGQMPEKALEQTMLRFLGGEHDVLLSTTIIENGLDIPRVNTILVNRADRFGLAQLYQLRGRVGRSDRRAYAYLLVPPRTVLTPVARKRLKALQDFSELGSGFRIAAMDLEIRGAGNLLGPEQHGHLAAVGFDTYCRLLEDAVRELRGEKIVPEVKASLNLRVDIRLPEEYIPDANQRLSLYKWISSARSHDELDGIRLEMKDRYGRIPDQGENLFRLADLRLVAERLQVASVDYAGGRVAVQFAPDSSVPLDRLIAVVSRRKGSSLSPEGTVRMPAGEGPAERVREVRAFLKELL